MKTDRVRRIELAVGLLNEALALLNGMIGAQPVSISPQPFQPKKKYKRPTASEKAAPWLRY